MTAGERLAVHSALGWVDDLLAPAIGKAAEGAGRERPDVVVDIERSRAPFPVADWPHLGRDGRACDRAVALRDAATSGFDLLVEVADDDTVHVHVRWRPPQRTRLAGLLLRSRFRLLARAVLLQYPVLWRAQLRGRAPLHAPACEVAGRVLLLAGPSGVGKSTLVDRLLQEAGRATSDNLVVSDGFRAFGLVEPMRVSAAHPAPRAPRTTHGRVERSLPRRADVLVPEVLVVLRRLPAGSPSHVARCTPEEAVRTLVGSTYMAGELRRFWGWSAALAVGSGRGPAHPPVSTVASILADRLPAVTVALGSLDEVSLASLLPVIAPLAAPPADATPVGTADATPVGRRPSVVEVSA